MENSYIILCLAKCICHKSVGEIINVFVCVQVKRKDPPDAASTGDTKRARPSTPVDDELEDIAELPEDVTRVDEDSAASRRRHARPLELDSEGEEKAETSGKEESLSDREEEPDETEVSDRLSSAKVSCQSNDLKSA